MRERDNPVHRIGVGGGDGKTEFESLVDDYELEYPAEETHATIAGAFIAGAITGGVIGFTAGPIGAAIGFVGGGILGFISERVMHAPDTYDDLPQIPPPTYHSTRYSRYQGPIDD